MNLPFQFEVGMAIQIVTRSFIGGCVDIAVTRQMPGLFASTAADSMVVFGSVTVARLSQVLTGLASGINALGPGTGAAFPRPPTAAAAPGAPPGAPAPRAPPPPR